MRRCGKPACNVMGALVMILCAGSNLACAQDDEEADDRGLTEYEVACMPCHGIDGKGDGPSASSLSKRPGDLTQIEKANGGIFPEQRVRDMIDGRADVSAHGPRAMPVWGMRYRAPIDTSDTAKEADKRARDLIDALVDYLKTMQQR